MIFLMVLSTSRRSSRTGQRAYMHHLAWGVVCVLLLLSIGGLWVHAQSLENQNTALEKQVTSLQSRGETTCVVDSSWKANDDRTLTALGRQYLVHTPAVFRTDTYYPLVMFYPGKGNTAEVGKRVYGLDTLPAILVYPSPTPSTDGSLAWEGAPYSSHADDVAFTSAILDKLQAELCVDKKKTYAVGMSNGGGFASLLSCRLADRFAAFAVASGAMYAPSGECTPATPRPLINIHGDNDGIVPYEGSFVRHLPHIDSWVATRAHKNGCKGSSTTSPALNQIVTVWTNCTNGATVENIRMVGGGHAWGQVPNDTLWQFLSRYSL